MVEFWVAALGLSLLLYMLLDGFDLGTGMLFPFAPDERARRHLLSSISPVWDGARAGNNRPGHQGGRCAKDCGGQGAHRRRSRDRRGTKKNADP